MSIVEKVFHFNENQINVVKCNDNIPYGLKVKTL